jgi:excisionase family DNA binding protein
MPTAKARETTPIEGVEPLYTIHEAAEHLKVHWQTVRKLERDGLLQIDRLPGVGPRIKASALRAYQER